jgi:bifunctional DNA-binding transcriptional regulator/antitoxin component of YhaV-PrlF toxin-antitoxin module
VREHLKVDTGDTVDFVIGDDGVVRVRAGDVDVTDLKGLLKQQGRRPVTLEDMDVAIARAQRRR